MGAFDFVITLLSFVYALAITHILATVGDIIRAGKRVRFSWLNAAWMLSTLLIVVAFWLGLWDMRGARAWTMQTVGLFFLVAAGLYMLARVVCAPIPAQGPVDLRAYHRQEGWKYLTGFSVMAAFAVLENTLYAGIAGQWLSQNKAVVPMVIASAAGACFSNRWVQIASIVVILAMWAWYFAMLQSALT
jgi:hypothetical protein